MRVDNQFRIAIQRRVARSRPTPHPAERYRAAAAARHGVSKGANRGGRTLRYGRSAYAGCGVSEPCVVILIAKCKRVELQGHRDHTAEKPNSVSSVTSVAQPNLRSAIDIVVGGMQSPGAVVQLAIWPIDTLQSTSAPISEQRHQPARRRRKLTPCSARVGVGACVVGAA